jgi:DNA-binding transcriptional ArsR family regulator
MSKVGTFLIETPEQLRAISDPLRQRLLQAFAEPLPVREAAARLGEPLTKLYHHVDQLLVAGLIRVAREERKRALVERYFQSNASRFAVVPSAFGGEVDLEARREALARTSLEELLDSAATGEGNLRLARSAARLNTSGLERLEAEVGRLLQELEDPSAPQVDVLLISARRDDGSAFSGSGS